MKSANVSRYKSPIFFTRAPLSAPSKKGIQRALIKKERKFPSYISKFRKDQVLSYMINGLLIYNKIFANFLIYLRKLFTIYDFAPDPF
jgi:hypothetical protein